MFTGIISEVGSVAEAGHRLTIEAPNTAAQLSVGGSVAVNGVCLTATGIDQVAGTFTADVVDETLARSNLGALSRGSKVNLELPLRAADPLDGHLVLGHVDGVGVVQETKDVRQGRELTLELPAELSPYVAEKGSIAVDGTSLTVTTAGGTTFGVALIPHTLEHTIAGEYGRGARVNLEVDVLARYVERLVRAGIGKR
jgi:riboflavin synthase